MYSPPIDDDYMAMQESFAARAVPNEEQTRILFHALRKMNIPTVIFINKIDQAGVDLQFLSLMAFSVEARSAGQTRCPAPWCV